MSKAKAVSAGLWSAIDLGLRQVVQFAVTVILARLLMPQDFGIIALALFFSSLATIFVQSGLCTALIQRRETTLAEESAAFWTNLAFAVVFACGLVAAAPAVSGFYNYPVLRPLMWMAVLQVVFSAAGAIQGALMTRDLEFAALAKAGVASTIVGGIAGIVAAMLGAGVWALAIQTTVIPAVNSAALWWISTWRPALRFRWAELRGLLGFGAWFSLSSTLAVLYTQGFSLVLGKLHGASELGMYNRASSTQAMPTTVLSAIIGRMALPVFASRGGDREALRRGLAAALQFAMLINLPMMIGVALLPDLIILVLFGAKWLPAAPILGILAWIGIFFPVHVLNLQIVLAEGRAKTYFNLEMLKNVIGFTSVVIGSYFGILGLAISQVTISILALFINNWPVRRSLGYGLFAQFLDFSDIILATAVMAGAILIVRHLTHLAPVPELGLLTVAGILTYVGTGFLLRLPSFREAVHVVGLLLPRPRRETA